MLRNTDYTYGTIAKTFHWLVFLFVLVNFSLAASFEIVPENYQGITYNTHKLVGLTILLLMCLRFLWTMSNPKPLLPFDTPGWQRLAERVVHWLFYIVLIGMPVAGWIGSCAAGRPPHFFSYSLNLPIAQNKWIASIAFDFHEALAWVLIILLTIHISAALYHFFIKKDRILQRMLPYGRGGNGDPFAP